MGNELVCTMRHAGKSFSGKALLESSEIIFRGEHRCKIPFTAIKEVTASDGDLYIQTKDGIVVFQLGAQASKWRDKIAHPKSLLDKVGVKPGATVSLIGEFPADFIASLEKQGAVVSRGKPAKQPSSVFFLANTKEYLKGLRPVIPYIQDSTALWLVFPKGQKDVTEHDVRASGLKGGLVDIKVVSFSATHTALKFVLPKSKR
ncbi:MAG: hypothetical protein WBR26_13370 [Candidatus Acidiferrum sp.]